MTETSSLPQVDEERPWLGLLPFTENTQRFFFGRDQEIREIFLRVRKHPLTVLYGPSGLGKSSLLGAGLIPKLKVESYRPLLLRLRFEDGAPSPLTQVTTALDGLLGESMQNSLWERFHHLASRPQDLDVAAPVLIFDQFEEIFTLTEHSPERQRQIEVFFVQLADLLENRPPEIVEERLAAERFLADDYDFLALSLRVVLTLRQDHLSQLEAWKKTLPSLMRNRMELSLLDGKNALAAVVLPGRLGERELVDREVGERIVRFVAKRPAETPIEDIGAVPPILSLLCYELNDVRLKTGSVAISGESLERQSEDILQSFYDRCFATLPEARNEVRRFVEERLLTASGGHRNAVAREDAVVALGELGVQDPGAAIAALVASRLLTPQEQGGIERLEITHDVLAPLAVRSRDKRREWERAEKAERQQQKARDRERQLARDRLRLRWMVVGISVLATASFLFGVFAWRLNEQAERLVAEASRKALGSAQASFENHGDPLAGLAHLSEALRYRPESESILTNIASRLSRRATLSPFPGDVVLHHQDQVHTARLSKDGRFVLTASADNTAQLWEVASGQPSGSAFRLDDALYAADISGDGRRVAAATSKGSWIWDVAGGAATKLTAEPSWDVNFSPDGRRLVVSNISSQNVQIWNVAGRSIANKPILIHEAARRATFSPDGRWVLTACLDTNMARIWNAADGRPTGTSFPGGGYDAKLSPDGRWIAVAGVDKSAQLWNLETRFPMGQALSHTDKTFSVAFSADARLIVTSGADGTARLWQVPSGRPVGEPVHHGTAIHEASFSPDGRKLVTASADGTARFWDLPFGQAVHKPFRHIGMVAISDFSPDGQSIVTASGDTARLWNLATGKPIGKPLRHFGQITSASFSPDGRSVLVASLDKTVQIWDLASRKPLRELRNSDSVMDASFSPDGRRIVTATWDKSVRVWTAATGEPLAEIRTESQVEAASFSPSGRWILTLEVDSTVHLWEAASGKAFSEGLHHKDHINKASFSPDSRWILTASDDKTARLWETATGRQVGDPFYHGGRVTTAAFSPDGRGFVTAGEDQLARLWDVRLRKPLGEPIRHDQSVVTASFSPDSRWLLTASGNTAQLWETASGRPAGEPLHHDQPVLGATFSADGRWILTRTLDNTARLWDLGNLPGPSSKLSAALEAIAGQRISGDGLMVTVPPEERLAWRKKFLSASDAGSEKYRLVRWYLADTRTRTLSPNSKITIPRQIESEIDWVLSHPEVKDRSAVLEEAYLLDPSHPLILLTLAAFEKNRATRDLYLKLGFERLPADARQYARAAEILQFQGDSSRARFAAMKALAIEPENGKALAVQGWAGDGPAHP